MASAATTAASFGLLAATGAIGLASSLDQLLGALSSARALPPLDVVVEVVMAVSMICALNTAMASIHARIYNGCAAAANRRTLDGVCFVVWASTSVLLHLIFFLQPGAMDGAQDLLPLAVAVVRALLPASVAVTFFVSIILIYAHICSGGAGGGAGTGNMAVTTSVKLLTKVTHAAALVTIVLSLVVSAIVAFYCD